MAVHTPTLLDMLATVSDEAFEQWDKGMRSGKILTALAGRIDNYKPEITAVRSALAEHAALVAKVAALEADRERFRHALWRICDFDWPDDASDEAALDHVCEVAREALEGGDPDLAARAALALAKDA